MTSCTIEGMYVRAKREDITPELRAAIKDFERAKEELDTRIEEVYRNINTFTYYDKHPSFTCYDKYPLMGGTSYDESSPR